MVVQKKNFNGKGQVVLFKLGMEKYSLDLFNVLHIIKLDKLAKIEPIQLPQFPFYVEMIVQLQGRFIPVIDLRKKLTLSQQDYLDENRIIVLKVKNINLGIAVDATHSIISISNSYERGIIRELDNYLISLLNIKRYTSTDKEEIHSLAT